MTFRESTPTTVDVVVFLPMCAVLRCRCGCGCGQRQQTSQEARMALETKKTQSCRKHQGQKTKRICHTVDVSEILHQLVYGQNPIVIPWNLQCWTMFPIVTLPGAGFPPSTVWNANLDLEVEPFMPHGTCSILDMILAALWNFNVPFYMENRVYSQWNSHLIGIVWSLTSGFMATLFSDTPICRIVERRPSILHGICNLVKLQPSNLAKDIVEFQPSI